MRVDRLAMVVLEKGCDGDEQWVEKVIEEWQLGLGEKQDSSDVGFENFPHQSMYFDRKFVKQVGNFRLLLPT